MRDHAPTAPLGRCPTCGKLWHRSRKAARKFMRRNRSTSGVHQSVYRCPVNTAYFHIGRLDERVISGQITRYIAYGEHHQRLRLLGADPMTNYTTASPGYEATPAVMPGVRINRDRPARNGNGPTGPQVNGSHPNIDGPGDRTTGQLDILLTDLSTYRFVPQVQVTPSLARRLLELNADNQRNMKDKKVDLYARDMSKGNWREQTGQVLQIDTTGRLINGQNRLQAVVRSGISIRFDLCFGVDPADITVIDSHTPRSTADIIKTSGGGDLVRVASIVKHVLGWEAGYPKGAAGSAIPTPMEIQQRYHADANLFEAAAARGSDCARRGVGTVAALGVAYFVLVAAQRDVQGGKAEVDDFYDQLVSGIYPVSDPGMWGPYKLREKMLRYRIEKLTRPEMIALVVRIWNRHNTLVAGARTPVDKVQLVRSLDGEGLTNDNFPRPKKALRIA